MLKGIPDRLSPDLFKIMMEMGHGDEIVLADANFPAASCAKRLVRSDGHAVPALLDDILQFFPLDVYEQPVAVMDVVPGDPPQPPIWETYRDVIQQHEASIAEFERMERFAFYERAKKAYAIVATGETALYANIILKKGVIKGGMA